MRSVFRSAADELPDTVLLCKPLKQSLKSSCIERSLRQDTVRNFVKDPSRPLKVDRVFCLGACCCIPCPIRNKHPPSPLFCAGRAIL